MHKYKHRVNTSFAYVFTVQRMNRFLKTVKLASDIDANTTCNSQSDAVLLSDASQVTDSVIVLDSDCEADINAAILSSAMPTCSHIDSAFLILCS